jgi:hypothetical protein
MASTFIHIRKTALNRFFYWIIFSIVGLFGFAASQPDVTRTANKLRWQDAETGAILFTMDDIVRVDWERQLLQLKRETAMGLDLYLHQERKFAVLDAKGMIGTGHFYSPFSSHQYEGLTIWHFDDGVSPPLYALHWQYGESRDGLFYHRLLECLKEAHLIGTILPAENPQPIEAISCHGHSDGNGIGVIAKIFTETFHVGQSALVHITFYMQSSLPETIDTVDIHSTLMQDTGYFCTAYHSITSNQMVVEENSGVFALRWKPWGPVLNSLPTYATPGSATLLLNLTFKQKIANGKTMDYSVTLPAQKITL